MANMLDVVEVVFMYVKFKEKKKKSFNILHYNLGLIYIFVGKNLSVVISIIH